MFLSDEGPTLETLDFTIHICSTPTFLYFDLYMEGPGSNYPYSQPVSELRRTQIKVQAKLKVYWNGLRQSPCDPCLNTDHSLGLNVDFTEEGKPENPEKKPRSTRETNYNNSAATQGEFQARELNQGYSPGHPPKY